MFLVGDRSVKRQVLDNYFFAWPLANFDADGSLSTLDRDFARECPNLYPTVSKPKPKNILWIGLPMYGLYGIPIHHGY